MTTQQVKFRDNENGTVLGGILVNEKYIICGECGSVFDIEDVEVLQYYDTWLDLSGSIIGG